VSPGVIVRVRDLPDARLATVEMSKLLRHTPPSAGDWATIAQWAGALHKHARRCAKDLGPVCVPDDAEGWVSLD
jgi:hypothetical protein